MDSREAKVAMEMAGQGRAAHQHLPLQQRPQDIIVQNVNVLQRYPDNYNGKLHLLVQ